MRILVSTTSDMNTSRPYTMTTRARAVEETRGRIIDACVALHGERPVTEIGLEEASFERAEQAVADERRTPVGDVTAAVRVIVDHYERRGDQALLMLAQEGSQPLMARITERGKALHRAWVEEVFAPDLAGAPDPEALTDLLVVATDVYTWKLLRRDRGL